MFRQPLVCIAVLCVVCEWSSFATAQEAPKPGPEHEILKQHAGTWDAVMKMADGQSSKATMTQKMAGGGLWLVVDYTGDFLGQKFEGHGIDGYDTTKKKFTSIWVDSMSTAAMHLEGTYDEKTKSLTMTGEGPGPDGKPAKYRSVTGAVKDDKFEFTMSLVGADGKETKMFTIEYTRRKE